jgi:periplasmic divalent cation tolerance protein
MDILICFVTAPSIEVASALAKQAVDRKLAACVNIVPGVRSVYRWQDEIAIDEEVLMLIKTVEAKRAQLQEFIMTEHPYDTPEFLVLSADQAAAHYANWLRESVL